LNYIKDVVPITQKHQIIAVLPPITTIERKIWMSDDKYKEMTVKKQNELQKNLSNRSNIVSKMGPPLLRLWMYN
jgi:hypothetical protein